VKPDRRIPYEDIHRQLVKIFHRIVFAPVMEIIKAGAPGAAKQIQNADDSPFRHALQTGGVQYREGVFTGQFSAAISRGLRSIGAVFDRRAGVYRLDPALAPSWVLADAAVFQEKAKEVHRVLLKRLDEMDRDIDKAVDAYPVDAGRTVGAVNEGFKEVARELELLPTLSEDARERLAQDYSKNMGLWIRKFSSEQIQQLREIVERNAGTGYRFAALIGGIQNRYSVAQTKATFLARQETALFMSKFRRERYGEAGVTHYKWSTSHDERVRDRHKHLDGKVFPYASPPIVDDSTGRRGNPGEDFNCRCVDIPILVKKPETGYA
jgi:SPP1 gp7 family putative phage head morphogenesis protein